MKLLENTQTLVPISDPPVRDPAAVESDTTLLESARTLDKDALIQIFDRYVTSLYRYALRLCHDPLIADQIVGDVFAKLLDQFSEGRGPRSNLRSYLYQMTYHQVVDETRYSNRRAPLDALDGIRYDDSAVSTVEDRLMFETVMQAVQTTLTSDQQNVIILRFQEGMSLSETALIMGKRLNHVKVLQSRAIQRLRRTLQDGQKKDVKSEHASHNLGDAGYEFAV